MNVAQPLLQPYRMGELPTRQPRRHGAADTEPRNESRLGTHGTAYVSYYAQRA